LDRALTHLFPKPGAVAEIGAVNLAVPAARRKALRRLTRVLADGEISLDPGSDREEAERRLLALRGIGPWTASHVAMRALGDPDAFLPTDLGVRRAVRGLGGAGDPAGVAAMAERWRPWRAYATQHLWASLSGSTVIQEPTKREVLA
jgi:AraC family transcriptional regulator of adaptative response / DNA-3-methyladenine glycosylase II